MTLIIGDDAPNFSLVNQHGETVTLSDFAGKKPVVLVFYPLSFSGICTGELCELRDNFGTFERENVELLAISVDSKYVQKVFAEQEGYKFSVLADFWPHGAVARTYEVFLEEAGISNRATFVIDKAGVVRHSEQTATPKDLPDFNKIAEVLASL